MMVGFSNAEAWHQHLITLAFSLEVAMKNHKARVARKILIHRTTRPGSMGLIRKICGQQKYHLIYTTKRDRE